MTSWKSLPRRAVIIGFLLVLGLGMAFYFVLGRKVRFDASEQILKKQQIISQAEASNIVAFFQSRGRSVSAIAQLSAMEKRDESTTEALDGFVREWGEGDLIGGAVLTDKNGIVRFHASVSGVRDTGVSLADRDYFLWAKSQKGEGDYFIGKPVVSRFGTSRNLYIAPIASPVFRGEEFTGVLVISVKLEALTKRYLELMKVVENTETSLISGDGKLIYSNVFSDGIGENVFEYLKDNPFQGSAVLAELIKSGFGSDGESELKAKYLCPFEGRVQEHSLVATRVDLGTQHWLLVMSTPNQDDLRALTIPLYIRLIVLFAVTLFFFVLFGAVVVRDTQKRLS